MDPAKAHTWTVCSCAEFHRSRVPACQCAESTLSPLQRIRWKRLVIDEGHVSATVSTTLVPMVKLLSVEHRWIVTGTPTTNLLGLSLGQRSTTELDDDPCPTPVDMEDESVNVTDLSTPSRTGGPHVWSKHDREDLRKLGVMMTHFVGVPRFKTNAGLFKSHITEALLDSQGPRIGAIKALEQTMQSVMIRHRSVP